MKRFFCLKSVAFFVVLFSIFINIFTVFLDRSDKSILSDNAVLSRFFSVTDVALNFVSDNLNFDKITKNQTDNPVATDIFTNCNDLILNCNSNFSKQLVSGISFLFFASINCLFIFFLFKFYSTCRLWRCIFVKFLSKLLFSLLPRSVSVKVLLSYIKIPCALFFKHKVFYLV